MPAGQTYEKIATNTLSVNTQTVDFTSIPQTYTDLVIVVEGRATTSDEFKMRVGNGSPDSGNNYSRIFLYGSTSGANIGLPSNISGFIYFLYSARSMAIINLMNYANTNVNKTALIRNNNGIDVTYASGNLWRSTVAIDYLQFTTTTHSFSAGTVFSIYGIKKA